MAMTMALATATGTVDAGSRWSMASLRSALPSPSTVAASSSSSTHCGHRGLRLSLSLSQSVPKPQKYFGSFTGLSPFNPLGLSDNTSFEQNFTIIDNGGRVYAMRHGRKVPKLNRPPDQRKALLRGLTTQLLKHGRTPSHHGSRIFTQRELEIATGEFNEAHLLGRGTFGTVYKAIVDDGDTIMAVKVLHGDSIQSYKSFKRECQIMSEIKHRNLVRMVGYTWNTQFKALILEYVGNGNLAEHLYPGGLEEGACELTLWERLSIAIDVANGLEYLQEGCPVQILHCDLKPENVLIDNDMVAHVADFGIGKLISADKPNELHVSTTHFLRGSIGYIPPEYGQGNEVSTKGDIYSFGVMVLELITRKRPIRNMFPDEVDLRNWVHSSYPDHVLDVVDSALKEVKSTEGALQELERCCIQMLDVGLMCTEDTPQKRPSMSFVVQKLTVCLKSSKLM